MPATEEKEEEANTHTRTGESDDEEEDDEDDSDFRHLLQNIKGALKWRGDALLATEMPVLSKSLVGQTLLVIHSVRAGAGPAGLRSPPPEFVRPGVRRTPRQSPAVGPAEAGPPRQ